MSLYPEGILDLHRRATVVDSHCDTLIEVAGGRRSLGTQTAEGHVDLPRLAAGGVDVQFFACFIEPEFKPDRALKRTVQLIDCFYRELDANQDQLGLATTAGEIATLNAAGRIAAILSVEGGEALEGELGTLRILYRLGVRSLTLTWSQRNDLGDGVNESRTGGGLTTFGLEVVAEMNSLGMIVDVSHLSERGFWDVVEASRAPFIASHSNAYAVCPHRRNLNDDQLRALAKLNGVVGLTFVPAFIDPARPTLDRLLDHADYIAGLIGPDHLGLGSDFDGIDTPPAGLEDVGRMPGITAGLAGRGWKEADIRKVLGENYLRLFRQVFGG